MSLYDKRVARTQTLMRNPNVAWAKADANWIMGRVRFLEHTRSSKKTPDAKATLDIIGHKHREDLSISFEETFTMSNGMTRSSVMDLTLSPANVQKLRELLSQIGGAS